MILKCLEAIKIKILRIKKNYVVNIHKFIEINLFKENIRLELENVNLKGNLF